LGDKKKPTQLRRQEAQAHEYSEKCLPASGCEEGNTHGEDNGKPHEQRDKVAQVPECLDIFLGIPCCEVLSHKATLFRVITQ
jgi:hypothetical protein